MFLTKSYNIGICNINYSLLTRYDHRLKHLKCTSYNVQNISYGEISSRIYETYNNAVRSHGCHIYNTTADMTMATMFPCTSKKSWDTVLEMCVTLF